MRTAPAPLARALRAAAFALPVVGAAFPREAHAQRELLSKPGERGVLVFDQLSGLRTRFDGGVEFYAPIGFATQSSRSGALPGVNESTLTTRTFYVSPSADYFLINHLSIGLHVELATTRGSRETRLNPTVTQSTALPPTTNVTFLPRMGWMFAFGDRFAVWPRVGLGYTSQQSTSSVGVPQRFFGAIVDIDVALVYRFNEVFFMRVAPELTASLDASRSATVGPVQLSSDASMIQFGALFGFGAMLNLL